MLLISYICILLGIAAYVFACIAVVFNPFLSILLAIYCLVTLDHTLTARLIERSMWYLLPLIIIACTFGIISFWSLVSVLGWTTIPVFIGLNVISGLYFWKSDAVVDFYEKISFNNLVADQIQKRLTK